MKIKQLLFTLGIATPVALASCSSEKDFDLTPVKDKAQGSLILNLEAEAGFESQTRALNENNYKNTANYNVKIINNANDNILVDCKASELSAYLPKTVQIGTYTVLATYGNEHAASRDEFFMTGSSTVRVNAKEEKTVNVTCSPTCGKVSVQFASDMATYYEDYSVSFSGTSALGSNKFSWAKTDTEPWYIKLNEAGETVNYTISLTAKPDYMHKGKDGSSQATGVATGSFKLYRNKAHKLSIKPNYTPTTEGGMSLTITIDESTNDHEITWDVPVTWI